MFKPYILVLTVQINKYGRVHTKKKYINYSNEVIRQADLTHRRDTRIAILGPLSHSYSNVEWRILEKEEKKCSGPGIICPDPDPYPALKLNYVFLKRSMFLSTRSHHLAIKSYKEGSDLMDIARLKTAKCMLDAQGPSPHLWPGLRVRIHYLGTYLDPAFLKVFGPDLEVQNATLNEKILN
jgi:hypothetical protein